MLDIDDTITYAPEFFRFVVEAATDTEVSVVTFRADFEDAVRTLEECQIRFDRLVVLTDAKLGKTDNQSLAQWKAQIVNELTPDWFFEDMPEVVTLSRPDIKVFMPCDEFIRAWLMK